MTYGYQFRRLSSGSDLNNSWYSYGILDLIGDTNIVTVSAIFKSISWFFISKCIQPRFSAEHTFRLQRGSYSWDNRGLLIYSDLDTQSEANLGSHPSPAWVPSNMAHGYPHHAARYLGELYLCSHFLIHVCWKVYPQKEYFMWKQPHKQGSEIFLWRLSSPDPV